MTFQSVRPLALLLSSSLLIHASSSAQMVPGNPGHPTALAAITISRFGVYPKRVDLPNGPFLLLIQNRSFFYQLNMVLTRPDVANMGAVLTSEHTANKADRAFVIALQPGAYRLTATGHPDLFTELVVGR